MRVIHTIAALTMIDCGKKVRKITWKKNDYIRKNINGYIVDREGKICPIEIRNLNDKWEIVEE